MVADIGFGKYTGRAGISTKTNLFDIGPFLRYAKSLSDIFAIYGQLQGVFGWSKTAGVSSTTAAVGTFPAVFINVKMALDLTLMLAVLVIFQANLLAEILPIRSILLSGKL